MKIHYEHLTKVLAKCLNLSSDELAHAFYPANKLELDDVLTFRKSNLHIPITWDDRNYLTWRYNFNGQTNIADTENYLWIIKINNEILGIIGVQHIPLLIQGTKRTAHSPLDLLVHKKVDGIGIGAWMNAAIKKHYPLLLVIGATEKSKNILKRLFHPMPDIQMWKMPLSIKGKLRQKIKSKIAVELIGSVVDPLLLLWHSTRLGSFKKNICVESATCFPAEVEKINKTWLTDGIILQERSSSYLNWRFSDNPEQKYELLLFKEEEKILGYSVFQRSFSKIKQQSEGVIVDFFWRRGQGTLVDDEIINCILTKTIKLMISQNIKLISIASYRLFEEIILKKHGFSLRDEPLQFSVYTDDSNLKSALFDPENWFLTGAALHGTHW